MYLYCKGKYQIKIYSFKPNEEAIIKFKKDKLQKRNINKLIYEYETSSMDIVSQFSYQERIIVKSSIGGYFDEESCCWCTSLLKQSSQKKQNQEANRNLIDRYISGDFLKAKTLITSLDSKKKNKDSFLITSGVTGPFDKDCFYEEQFYKVSNIIKLPEKLATLQLLEKGKFYQLSDEEHNFADLLPLFDLKFFDAASLKRFKNLIECGLLEDEYRDVMARVSITQKILEKIINYKTR